MILSSRTAKNEGRDRFHLYRPLFRRLLFGLVFTFTLLVLLRGVNYELNGHYVIRTSTLPASSSSSSTPIYTPSSSSTPVATPAPLFAFLHMAKTSGTTINGMLSTSYRGICGNKGFDYDIFQRLNQNYTYIPKAEMEEFLNKGLNKGFNASRNGYISHIPPTSVQKELMWGAALDAMDSPSVDSSTKAKTSSGTCHYLAAEWNWRGWRRLAEVVDRPVQLHVPCRDPIDHFMSMCNFLRVTVDCQKDFATMVQKCGKYYSRYSNALHQPWKTKTEKKKKRQTAMIPNHIFDIKCFNVSRRDEYYDWVGERLPPSTKRVKPKPYTFRSTNKPRNMGKECVWKNTTLRNALRTYLVENVDYYGFCGSCVGSFDDLLRSW